jgi:hypothetical protein
VTNNGHDCRWQRTPEMTRNPDSKKFKKKNRENQRQLLGFVVGVTTDNKTPKTKIRTAKIARTDNPCRSLATLRQTS